MDGATSTKRQKIDNMANFVMLPEEVWRKVFSLLDDKTIYFTIRRVCKSMKDIVDEYIQLGGIFLMGSAHERSTEVIYVFMKRRKPSSIHMEQISTFPIHPNGESIYEEIKRDTWVGQKHLQYMGGIFDGKIMVLCNYNESHDTKRSTLTGHRRTKKIFYPRHAKLYRWDIVNCKS